MCQLVEDLSAQVIGQDEAVRSVTGILTKFKSGLNDPRRPLGVFLFCGPTGVGKTALVRALGNLLFAGKPEKERLIRLDMSEYAGHDASLRLLGNPLGKPSDRMEALAMLARLSGREHLVLTAVCLRHAGRELERMTETRVQFVTLSREQVEAYIDTGEPYDKAGAYGIQGLASAFVESVNGSYTGVVGLPLAETWALLQRCGITTAFEAWQRV